MEKSACNKIFGLSALLKEEVARCDAILNKSFVSHVGRIEEISNHLASSGGKRLRPLMTLAFARMLGGDMSRATHLGACVELIHMASLLHDDVVDDAPMRRSKQSAHCLWGRKSSILVGDCLFARAFNLMVNDGCLSVLKTLSRASAIITEGEMHQLCTLGNLRLSIKEALEIMASKTASLFSAATEVGAIVSASTDTCITAAKKFGYYFGMAFQLQDDICDYDLRNGQDGKKKGNDFAEGKVTLPVILALETASKEEHTFWKQCIGKQGEISFTKAQAFLTEKKSIERANHYVRTYAQKAIKALDAFPGGYVRTELTTLCQKFM